MQTAQRPAGLILAALLSMIVGPTRPTEAAPLGTSFTYQGQLVLNGSPVTGIADLRFDLYDQATGGPLLGTFSAPSWPVQNGLFTVDLDFGTTFINRNLWLEIQARYPAGSGAYVPLSPRQGLTAAPFAHFAAAPWRTNSAGDLYYAGDVGIGSTTSPMRPLHILSPQAIARLTTSSVTFGSVLELQNLVIAPTYLGAINFLDPAGNVPGQIAYLASEDALTIRVNDAESCRFESNGTLAIGAPSWPAATTRLFAAAPPGHYTVAQLQREGDGRLISFLINGNGFEIGTITVAGSTVSYNSFTGSHLAHVDRAIERGALVRLTGTILRDGTDPGLEPIYGVVPTATANDARCLGAYLGPCSASAAASRQDVHLVMSVGNGDMWVVDSGAGDIEPGDCLISSNVPGCAMKDDPLRYAVGHVAARAAEQVHWRGIQAQQHGGQTVKRARISILFDRFERHSDGGALASKVEAQQRDIEAQQRDIAAQQCRIESQERKIESLEAQLTALQALADRFAQLDRTGAGESFGERIVAAAPATAAAPAAPARARQ